MCHANMHIVLQKLTPETISRSVPRNSLTLSPFAPLTFDLINLFFIKNKTFFLCNKAISSREMNKFG